MLSLVLPLPILLNLSFLYLLLLLFLLFFLPPFLVLFLLLFVFHLLCLKLTLLRGKPLHPAVSTGKLNEQFPVLSPLSLGKCGLRPDQGRLVWKLT